MAKVFPTIAAVPFATVLPGEFFLLTTDKDAALSIKTAMNTTSGQIEQACVFRDVFGSQVSKHFPCLIDLQHNHVVYKFVDQPEIDFAGSLPGRPDPMNVFPPFGTISILEIPAQQHPAVVKAHTKVFMYVSNGTSGLYVDVETGVARFPHLPPKRLLIDKWSIVLYCSAQKRPQELLSWP